MRSVLFNNGAPSRLFFLAQSRQRAVESGNDPFLSKVDIEIALPKTNSLHLKMDAWNTILTFWGPAYFQVRNGC